MKMENSVALSIFFLSGVFFFFQCWPPGTGERILKAAWLSANARDVFQSYDITWYDTGKYSVELPGPQCSRCRRGCGWDREKTLHI